MALLNFLHPGVLTMAMHINGDRILQAFLGHPRYPGTATAILRASLEACWEGRYLTASPGKYRQFWTRDTGFAAPALVRLGDVERERLLLTYDWAISIWRRRRSHVTTTISPPFDWPIDLFDYGVDSLPLLLAALRLADAADLVDDHRDWLAAEVEYYCQMVVDDATGLVRTDRTYSAHRDTFRNSSTAYGNTMVALLGRTVAETGWGPDLLSRHFGGDWGSLLRTHFWMGDRFRDRIGTDQTSGEANVWPFFAGVIDDPEMEAAALATLQRDGFAAPYPLRFDIAERRERLLFLYRFLSPDYQTTTSWTSLGSIYLSLLREVDPARATAELGRM
ncbi:MAG TPA: hypothetical protein VEX41_04385, partial [Candidatus Eisenbacteria bacterium]|nr:hypothetical protein [Candidatus Eisenbacteria bacterium]